MNSKITSISDYWYWSGLKRDMRQRWNKGELRKAEERKIWVEKTTVENFNFAECERAICGTFENGTLVGGYKSRLQSVLRIQGDNLCTLSRKERRIMRLMTLEELNELTEDGQSQHEDEDDDDEEVNPFVDDAE